MADISLPSSGQLNWDIPLNAAITTVDTDALSAQTNIANHSSNVPADPHGDRAYANSLVAPLTTGTNLPNGYVKLDGTGHIPANLISGTSAGGLYTKVFDAVGLYGMHSDGADTSSNLQNALNAANSAGGGIVYVGPGVFSLGNYVVIGSNTWLLLSEGTILQRIQGVSNPPYIISNVQFGTSNTPSTNFKISGGKLDAIGTQGLGSACTPIFAIQATKIEIRDISINNVFNNPAIELNGCNTVRIDFCHFTGAGSNFTVPSAPCIRINSSETSSTPTGLLNSLYNGATCQIVKITDCEMLNNGGTNGPWASFANSDISVTHKSSDIAVTAVSTKFNSVNNNPIVVAQWQNWTVDNCIFNDTANNITGTPWTNMTLKNGNSAGTDAFSNTYTPAYRMMPDGQLALRGVVNNGSNPNAVFATLGPAFGCGNSVPAAASVIQVSGNHAGVVTVDQGGNLTIQGNFAGPNENIYIDCTLRL